MDALQNPKSRLISRSTDFNRLWLKMTKLPKCFISYCYDNADFPAIDAFQLKIEQIARNNFEVIRDKSNMKYGGSINDHEQAINDSSIAIILFTPEYKSKIVERRPSGANREYNLILAKHNQYVTNIKNGRSSKVFQFIPVIFSGNVDSSIPDEVRDSLCVNLTGFRLATNKVGKHVLSETVEKQTAHVFQKLKSQFEYVKRGIDKEFPKEYAKLLDVLFSQNKHEATSKKLLSQSRSTVLDEMFVKTRTFKKVLDGDISVLVGRKGSGKSTIVDQFQRMSETHKPPINVNIDKFDLQYLYNFIVTKKHSSDLGDVVKLESYFEASWKTFIYRMCAITLVSEESLGHNVNNLSPFIESLIAESQNIKTEHWEAFVQACAHINDYVESSIAASPNNTEFYSELAGRTSVSSMVNGVLGKAVVEGLTGAIKLCTRRFLFALDGFDSRFEDFRNSSQSNGDIETEGRRRYIFERSWLKGLLRTVLDLRSSDSIIADKMDFCVTIPQDRFMEVRRDERDDYRFRMAANLQWTGIELSILLRKRFEALASANSSRELKPLARLEAMLDNNSIGIPREIEIRVGTNVVRVSMFKYLLRHSFWRPRDLLYYVAAILTTKKFGDRNKQSLDAGLIKEIVSRTTYDVVDSEFIKEFQKNIVNISEFILLFEGSKIALDFVELENRILKIPLLINGGSERLDDVSEKIKMLYEIGFLGVELDEVRARQHSGLRDMFVFSHGTKMFASLSLEQKKKLRYIINPIFVEFLSLQTDQDRIVSIYSDEFLDRNDQIGE